MDALQKSRDAFTSASLAAATLLRSVIESPEIAKSETAPGEAAAGLARILTEKIAAATVGPLDDDDYFEKAALAVEIRKHDQIAKRRYFEATKHKIHKSDCTCEPCDRQRDDDANYARIMAETWTAKAAMIDNTRPNLDSVRAERDGAIQSVPWREREKRPGEQHVAQENSPVVIDSGVSKMVEVLMSEGFESDGPLALFDSIDVYRHEQSQHRIEMNRETARFRAVSGYDYAIATGEGSEDLEQWLNEENEN